MRNFITISIFMLLAGKANAHTHPAANTLTHAVEHLLLSAQSCLPYLAGLLIAAPLATLAFVLHGRRSAK